MNSSESNGDNRLMVDQLNSALRGYLPELVEISTALHENPEIRFEEEFACETLSSALEEHGFEVKRGIGGLETAFMGEWAPSDGDEDRVTVAVFCEFDALEEIGHACGHNIIATAGLGAALLIKDFYEEKPSGREKVYLKVIGSPGEEGGAGKVPLIDAGVLDGVDFAVMVHPYGEDQVGGISMARVAIDVEFVGRASHAAAAPDKGVNALDAATLSLSAIGLLRQQLRDETRVHSIITDGGQAPNIIPEHTSIRTFVRSFDQDYLLGEVVPRVEDCFRGAGLATGCEVEIRQVTPPYLSMNPNPTMSKLVEKNIELLGRKPELLPRMTGSTDMANVSHVVPAIHPMISLEAGLNPHTREFAGAAIGPNMSNTIGDGALLLALTSIEIIEDKALLGSVQEEFQKSKGTEGNGG